MEIVDYTRFDDRTLTRRVVEGDSRAFDALFARHRDTIFAMLVKRSGNPDDVNDLLQEAFMKAFLNINEVLACIMTNWIAANIKAANW